ncbi:hypothetical protein [Streptomyces sp. NPDC048659]|uniref:hypothetical protein n=1 Tax=Streptomyces sp. NPDC048659 TaxID=3155489 RepID=UPI00342C7A41
MLDGRNGRRTWPWVVGIGGLALALVGGGLAMWAFVVNTMSDPGSQGHVGIRVTGGEVTVKVAQCPGDAPRRVEVWDSDTEKPVWSADGPLTADGRSGQLTLWKATDYRTATRTPASPPTMLDVSVDYGSSGSTGEVFDMSVVKTAGIPEGAFWTADGIKTAQQIDGSLRCSERAATAP